MLDLGRMVTLGLLVVIVINVVEAKECGVIPTSCLNRIYRSHDGTCNNLKYPWWGTIYQPYDRLCHSNYGDGICSIANSCKGCPLPNERRTRRHCLPDGNNELDHNITRMFSVYLEIMTHDMSRIDLLQRPDSCCTYDFRHLDCPNPNCSSIEIPCDDCMYRDLNADCMSVVNSRTNLDLGCSLTPDCQQISQTTSHLDLSLIYGDDDAKNAELREFEGGLLRLQNRSGHPYLPPNPSKEGCFISECSDELCLLSGNPKGNQNTDLAILITLFVREHNRLARKLAKINPCWNDERVYQEARRINIAMYQWMTYFETLPVLLGQHTVIDTKMAVPSLLYVEDYDEECRPNIFTEHAHAATRTLHSMIRGALALKYEERTTSGVVNFRDHLEHVQKFLEAQDNFDGSILGMTSQASRYFGPHHDFEITNKIFLRNLRDGIDLPALDIRRGRLCGMPSYNDMREHCGYSRAVSFDDFSDLIDPIFIEKLKNIYLCPDDVDFYVGGSLEHPDKEGVAGPTVKCVMVKQYLRTRKSDRFWFERKAAGFNLPQLNSIRVGSRISHFLCRNANGIKRMQPYVLRYPGADNPLTPCDVFPDVDLSLWKDFSIVC